MSWRRMIINTSTNSTSNTLLLLRKNNYCCSKKGILFNYYLNNTNTKILEPLFLGCYRRWNHTKTSTDNDDDNDTFVVMSSELEEKKKNSLTLYNSLSESEKEIPLFFSSEENDDDNNNNTKQNKKGLAWYTCGPTTYAPAHLGHARTYVCLDIVRRILEYKADTITTDDIQHRPLFVMNITDIDDKIILAAASSCEGGEDPLSLARRYEEEFWKDMDELNCLRPHIVTRVSEYVESDIVPYIEKLCSNGFTYETDDGVYFHIREYEAKTNKFTKYGKLAPSSAATADFFPPPPPDDGNSNTNNKTKKKKDPRDFVLWKKKKKRKDEEETISWNSPWGEGRPGWHIECSAMIEAISKLFKKTHTFRVHAGGIDLKFPHHTNEIAQAEAYHYCESSSSNNNNNNNMKEEEEWIPHWVHTGHLHIDGLKMSKSLKNFITIQEILHPNNDNTNSILKILSSPADNFRLWCLTAGGGSSSYRSNVTYSEDSGSMKEAGRTRERIVQFLIEATEWINDDNNNHSNSQEGGRTTATTTKKKWSLQDYEFYSACNASVHRAINNGLLQNDLDGTVFVQELINLVELGQKYYCPSFEEGNANTNRDPMRHCVSSLRKLLSLVGFTDKTVKAGIIPLSSEESNYNDSNHGTNNSTKYLIEELVQFRSTVRKIALTEKDPDKDHLLLKLCDELREINLPSIGLEIFDTTLDDDKEEPQKAKQKSWRYCLPKTKKISSSLNKEEQVRGKKVKENNARKKQQQQQLKPLRDIVVKDLFTVGQYKGKFSEYDSDGIPIKNADGTDVSNKLTKKLLKKRKKHEKRLSQQLVDNSTSDDDKRE